VKVIPIPKPNKAYSDPSKFHPISLLSSIRKVFKRVILKRFNDFLSNHNLLPHYQFGFRVAHSASHQLNRVVRHIKTNRESQKSTGMEFLDVKKAFDSVWPYSLWGSKRCHIVSFPIEFLHSWFALEQREWNCHIYRWYCDLCVQRRSRGGMQYTAMTPRFSFHVLQAVKDKNQRGQDPGNIIHPMLVSKETANCSYQGWGPSYPLVHRSKIP
jgi:hypothetical protein